LELSRLILRLEKARKKLLNIDPRNKEKLLAASRKVDKLVIEYYRANKQLLDNFCLRQDFDSLEKKKYPVKISLKGAWEMLIIDRFEEDWAVIEFGQKTFNIPKVLIPPKAREGDVINIQITLDREATNARAEATKQLADELFTD
jgi:hypothetical protein